MGACDSIHQKSNNINNYNSRQNSHSSRNERQTIKYFPKNNKTEKLVLNNDILVSNSRKNPFQIYTKLKLLGEGAFSQVWKVRNKITGKEYAMKIIEKNQKYKEKLIFNEIEILKRLDHPNIIKILEFYSLPEEFYIITEYCPEGDLFNEIKKGIIFSENQTAFIIYQILNAIRYCHKMRVIHEDIKPENIMITKRDENNYLFIKLIDFGTAKIFKEGNLQKGVVGSAYYMAPEVLKGNYNEECDIWSIGVIMHIMLTGSPPFDGKDDDSIFNKISHRSFSINSNSFKRLSNNAKDLIMNLLERDPSKRITARNALNHPWFNNSEFNKIINIENNLDLNEIHHMLNNLENYKNDNIIKSAVHAFLVHQNIDMAQCQNAMILFNDIDLNHDGKIESYELEQAFIKYYNINNSEARKKVKKIFETIDLNDNGFIENEEFIRGCIDLRLFNSENFMRYAFDYFDDDGNGYISIEELYKKFFQTSKNRSNMAKKNLKDLFDKIDEDKDGYISFEEFSWMMKNIINN